MSNGQKVQSAHDSSDGEKVQSAHESSDGEKVQSAHENKVPRMMALQAQPKARPTRQANVAQPKQRAEAFRQAVEAERRSVFQAVQNEGKALQPVAQRVTNDRNNNSLRKLYHENLLMEKLMGL